MQVDAGKQADDAPVADPVLQDRINHLEFNLFAPEFGEIEEQSCKIASRTG